MVGFKVGELIVVSKPYAYVLNNDLRGIRCDCCFKKMETSKRCAQCSFVYYCKKDCQVKAWKAHHKTECKLLKNAGSEISPDVRLLSLIIFKYKKYGPDEPFEETHGRRVTFGTLMSHAEDIERDSKETQRVMAGVREFIGEDNMPPDEEFFEIFGKMKTNFFSICEAIRTLGAGLYLGASVFDHSCDPNAAAVSEGVDLWIRVNRYIKDRDISKVYVKYIDEIQLTNCRQEQLMSNYYFLCQCSHCTSSERDELMRKTLVHDKDKRSVSLEIDKMDEIVTAAKKLEKLKAKESVFYLTCVEKLKDLVDVKNIPCTHISKVQALKILYDSCMMNGESSEALVYGLDLLKAYRLYLDPYHSLTGYHLFEISQLQFLVGKVTASLSNREEAKKILKVTLGEEHSMYRKLFVDHF